MSLLFAPFPITPAPIGVRGAFAAATSTTIHETDVLDEAWAKLKAVGASIGEAFDSVLASIKATATTSASDLMEKKNHDDDYATDEVSTPSDGASPTEANIDPSIDYDEDDDEVIAILEGDSDDLPILEDHEEEEEEEFPTLEDDNADTSMLEDGGVFAACNGERIKRVFATAARLITAALKAVVRWLAALLPKPKSSNTAAAEAKATAKATLKAKAKLTEWIGSEKFEMLASDDEDDDEDEDLLIEWIGSDKFEMLVYDEYEDEDWPSEDEA